MIVPPLPPGCPWSDWAPPNIKWAEENLCGWITAPANTWSNVAYFAVALLLWQRARAGGGTAMKAFAPACLFIGLSSFAFHASYTFFFQFFDYLSMFVLLAIVMGLNMTRSGAAKRRVIACVIGLVACFCGGVLIGYRTGFPFQLFIPALVLAVARQEWSLASSGRGAASYAWYFGAFACLLVAASFAGVDLSGKVFDPKNHWLQGHALWHLFSAASIYCAARFYDAA